MKKLLSFAVVMTVICGLSFAGQGQGRMDDKIPSANKADGWNKPAVDKEADKGVERGAVLNPAGKAMPEQSQATFDKVPGAVAQKKAINAQVKDLRTELKAANTKEEKQAIKQKIKALLTKRKDIKNDEKPEIDGGPDGINNILPADPKLKD